MSDRPDVIKPIFDLDALDELRDHITRVSRKSGELLQKGLARELAALVEYKNAREWNRLVRVCEAFTIFGWGDLEPMEATTERWINGQFFTRLGNRYDERRYREVGWSRLGKTFVCEERSSVFHPAPGRSKSLAPKGAEDGKDYGIRVLADQRVGIVKSPVILELSAGEANFKSHIVAWHALRERLLRELRPEVYGDTFGHVFVHCHVSDDVTQYFSKNELPENCPGNPVVKDRVECDRLHTKREKLCATTRRHLPTAFALLPVREQKERTSEELLAILELVFERLEQRRVRFGKEQLRADVRAILESWTSTQ